MKFMPGYQLRQDSTFLNEIIAQKEHIHEVYFSFGDLPNGRNSQLQSSGFLPHEAQARQLEELARLTESGISLNLLLNGNCYGRDSLSRAFFLSLGDTVDCLASQFSVRSVTTTSPVIAKFIKRNFESLTVRASVNMRVGTVEAMDYLSEDFDGFYMQREYNRDLEHIRHLKTWCDQNGKTLYMLANSGCFSHCPAQTFHDNLVSHERELMAMDNAFAFEGLCCEYLKKEEHYAELYKRLNFVRPEDMHRYDGLFTAAKLATRVSRAPEEILRSYVNGRYAGNILDILEPAHSIYPYVLENGEPPRLRRIDTDIPMYEGGDHADK